MKQYQMPFLAMGVAVAALSWIGGCLQLADQEPQDDLGSVEQLSTLPTSGLHLWLRADTGVVSRYGRVSKWYDQSGNGRNASMPSTSPTRQPYFVPGALNGLPVLRFAGAQSMYLDVFAQPTTFTVFVVGKNSASNSEFSMILGPGGNAPNNQLRWEGHSMALLYGAGNNMPITTADIETNTIYHELMVRYDGVSMFVFRDGSAIGGQSFSATGPWTLASIGSWYSTYYMQGDLAEVIIYDRALSYSEIGSVDSYLEDKYFPYCGDSVCSGIENATSCPSDCSSYCGDGTCNSNEDAWSCSYDCGYCGDGICSSNESSLSCSTDCGQSCLAQPCPIE